MRQEDKNKKPSWLKPKLIVLIREAKQERILDNCKNSIYASQFPGTYLSVCSFSDTGGACTWCSQVGSS